MNKATLLALLVLAGPQARADALKVTPAMSANLHALVGDVYANGRSFEFLEALSDELGPRLTGSENYEKAVRWAVDQFHAMGIADVRLEPVTLKHGWQRGTAHGQLLGAVPRPLHVAAFGWSPPTPKGGLRAPVTVLTDVTDEAIAAAKVRGTIVLIDRQSITGPDLFKHTSVEAWQRERRTETLGPRLRSAGALALLAYSKSTNQVLRTGDPVDDGEVLALPMAYVGREDALLVRRRLARGEVDIDLTLDTTVTGPVTVHSVVAQLNGREHPEESVILGAHLDSWDFATGAQDNGTGAAQVMDAARAIVALGTPPRRSMRFALWASEEEGLNGSREYVHAHAAEMRHVVLYLNSDDGSGRPLGWNVAGRGDLANALAPLAPMFSRIGGSATTDDLSFDTDTGGFLVAGVPTLDLDVVDDDYDAVVHHKPADTLDKVDAHDLAAGAAMLAVAGYAFAENAERPVRRLQSSEVQDLLKTNGALEYVETSDMKDLWHQ
jgi:carboxypeptidase Q